MADNEETREDTNTEEANEAVDQNNSVDILATLIDRLTNIEQNFNKMQGTLQSISQAQNILVENGAVIQDLDPVPQNNTAPLPDFWDFDLNV